jgi:hypothetical protein
MDKKEYKKVEIKKPTYLIGSFQVRDIIDGKLILNIDGMSVAFNGKVPSSLKENKNIIGNYVNIRYAEKNDKTKELKDSEIIV